jgi:outer membrane protein OmpA-like peptidoglycan-associated protein
MDGTRNIRSMGVAVMGLLLLIATGPLTSGLSAQVSPDSDRQQSPPKGTAPAVERAGATVYPWHTVTVDTHISGLLLVGIDGNDYLGGGTTLGASVRTTFLPGLRIGIEAGYAYQQTGDDATRSEIPVRLSGGYAFTPGGVCGLIPFGGIEVAVPVGTDSSPPIGLFAGGRLELHLYNRNKIFIEPCFKVTLSRSPEPRFGVSVGLKRALPILVPVREMEAAVSISPARISPDGDGYQDDLIIRTVLDHPRSAAEWEFFIWDELNRVFYSRKGSGPPPEEIRWDGISDWGEQVEQAAEYQAELYLTDKLDRVEFYSQEIVVDILLRREGDRYLIQVPYITFPPNSSDFSLLTDEAVIRKNRQVIRRLSEIFSRFPEYRILIEGHANLEFYDDPEKREWEQSEVLIPLSESRAEAVKDALVELGIEESRLSVSGVGGARPLVPFSDAENRWKNRRVEFILIRDDGTVDAP